MEISEAKVMQNLTNGADDTGTVEFYVKGWDELTLTLSGTSTSFVANVKAALDENKDYVTISGYKEDDQSTEVKDLTTMGGFNFDVSSYRYVKIPTTISDTGNLRAIAVAKR